MTQNGDDETQEVSVSFRMNGPDAVRFLRYKRGQYLKNTSEAARKLILERLAEIEKGEKAEA